MMMEFGIVRSVTMMFVWSVRSDGNGDRVDPMCKYDFEVNIVRIVNEY